MKKFINIPLSLILISLLFSGCSPKDPTENPPEDKPTDEELAAQEWAKKVAEREALETQRKAELGEFYVPLPPLDADTERLTVEAKGLYVTANVAGFPFNEEDIAYYADYIRALSGQSGQSADASRLDSVNKLEKILGIAEATEINALVIDIKNDEGLVTWNSDVAIVNQIGSNWNTPLKDYTTLMDYLKAHEIYSIARIVAFKDPYFAQKEPDHAIQLTAGGVYKDNSGFAWVNPFDAFVWKYQIALAQEAALRGFDEIQYDYVRFPDNAKRYNPITTFPGRNDRDKDEAIADFLSTAREALLPYNVHLSADVFGVITHAWDDKPEDIGQTWRLIANEVEYICPMIYPSHYGSGFYGFDVPDQHPYEVMRSALQEGLERNAAQKNPGIIRTWVQGFSAPWVKGYITYDAKAVADQLVAAADLGLNEYIIWQSSNNYDPMSFFYADRIKANIMEPGKDIMERSPEDALKRFLEAEIFKRYNYQYLLTPIDNRDENYDVFSAQIRDNEQVLKTYEIIAVTQDADGTYSAQVNGKYSSKQGTATMENAQYKIILENNVFKIIKPELTWVVASSS